MPHPATVRQGGQTHPSVLLCLRRLGSGRAAASNQHPPSSTEFLIALSLVSLLLLLLLICSSVTCLFSTLWARLCLFVARTKSSNTSITCSWTGLFSTLSPLLPSSSPLPSPPPPWPTPANRTSGTATRWACPPRCSPATRSSAPTRTPRRRSCRATRPTAPSTPPPSPRTAHASPGEATSCWEQGIRQLART